MRRASKYAVVVAACLLMPFVPRGLGLLSVFAAPEFALQFDGVDDRVTFGTAPALGAQTFTLELWFKKTGAGTTTTSGTGGVTSAIPLLTKGRGEGEGSTVDMNYFLGIDSVKRVLAADFEDTAGGVNHPVFGRTAICDNIWYHAAATYDGTTWRLFLNGELEATVVVGAFTPRFDSIQHAGLATAMTSTGVAAGFFKGSIDEARIWNVARSQAAIVETMDEPVTAAANLIGRWALDDGSGTTAANTAGGPTGSLLPVAGGPAWDAGISGFATGLAPLSVNDALRLTAGDYVSFGAASPALGASRFTVETWFKREGAGTAIGTGTNGLASVIPLVTKGRGEAEASNVDFNYFLGINTAATPVIAADFEEGATGANPGLNHPISGSTPILLNTWYHAAVTYDGTSLQLYVNGLPDGAPVVVGQPPRADSIMPVALGTALNSTSVASGAFAGLLDETRIWNYARTPAQMAAGANREIPAGAGLLGRWSFNDCCGRVADSTGQIPFGTLMGPGWSWVPRGTPALSVDVNTAPTVAAGPDLAVTLPNIGSLSGVVNDDTVDTGTTLAIQWSQTSGPGLVTFGAPTAPVSNVSFSATGTYVLTLTANDGELSTSDAVTVIVDGVAPAINTALQLGGTNAYVTFGAAPQLGASTFTLETWFRRDGAGIATNTGSGGVLAIPLVTKGMAEVEGSNVDMNYFLGIRQSDGVLVADFEDTTNGGNHPVAGVTPVVVGPAWHHAAVTYDGTTWRLYLDGALDRELAIGAFTPRFDSIQHAAIGTALNSAGGVTSGQPAGRFHGVLDEVRIWSYARTLEQIQSGTNREIPAASGLLGRFGLNEGTGTGVASSVGPVTGTIVGSNWSWVSGAHVTGGLNTAPTVDAGTDQAVTLPGVVTLSGLVGDDLRSGTLVTTRWSQVSGPGTAVFGAPAEAVTTVDFPALGIYVLRLTADDGELSATDDIAIEVTGVVNTAPVVEAGANQIITLPTNATGLSGTAVDAEQPVGSLTTAWSKVSGPGTVTFANPAEKATDATFSMQGVYVLRLTASDGLLSGSDTVTVTVNADPANKAIDFGGTNAFVTLGAAPGLGASRFTLETWFRRDGAGIATNTGTGGVIAIPLVTKGMAEVDDVNNRDMNYFLGIRQSDGVLVADFEDTATGGNHPVAGVTPVVAGPEWRHAAVSYDGTTWRLYLDGQLDRELVVGAFTPRADSIQHAAIGTALNSTGGVGSQPAGFFNGVLDEARIWNYARSAQQIDRGRRLAIGLPTPGLLGRWGLNEGVGTSAGNSAGSVIGTVIGSNWSWTEGAPFTGANQAPSAVDDLAATSEDVAATIAVLGNDSDADGDALTLASVSSPAHGTATANADGTIGYTPAANYSGADSFSYTISDGQGGSATAAISVTVADVNDPPVAAADTAVTSEDTPIAIAVLANDSDGDSATLTPIVDSGPANGSATVEADGSITYAPAANFNGADSFTYKVSDGAAESGVVTVTITVAAVNDAPVAGAESYSLDEDGSLVVGEPGVLGNDGDADGDTLSAGVATDPAHGSLTLNADGTFSYTPDANYHGADSFTYRANDGVADSAEVTVTLTINSVNDLPAAVNDAFSTNEDTAISAAAPGVLANDSDPDSSPLTAIQVSGPSNGTLALNADGSFIYTPNANFNGVDSFTYKVNDGSADSSVATVTIALAAVNDAPVAGDGTFSINEDTTLTVGVPGVLDNDSDAEGSSLSAVLVTGVAHGTLTLNPDGSFLYTPAANFHGNDAFTYQASDGTDLSNVATVNLSIVPTNDPPVASDDQFSTAEETILAVAAPGVFANDTDDENETLTATLVATTSRGSLTFSGDGSFIYTPAADYSGPDSFSYRVSDGSADSAIATVTLTVIAVNDAPVARADSFSTLEDIPLVVDGPGVVGNDTDPDGDPLSAVLVRAPRRGTLALNVDGSFSYTPAADYNGADSFTYKVNDGTADSNVVTVAIAITAVTDLLVAVDNSYTRNEDVWFNVGYSGVLANDRLGDDDGPLTAVLVSGPTHGELELSPNGNFDYTPAPNFHGIDSFTYQAHGATMVSNIATVIITIKSVNDLPAAPNETYTTNEDRTLTVAAPGVLGNDTDVESAVLTAVRVSGPSHGTLALATDGGFTYTPNANYYGTDTFVYRVRDGDGGSDTATVTLVVDMVEDAPVANAQSKTVIEDSRRAITLTATDVDAIGAPTFTIVTPPVHGVLTGEAPLVTYEPAPNYNGPDSFTFIVTDGELNSNVATVSLTVTAVNDAPVAQAAVFTTPVNTSLSGQVVAADIESDPLTYTVTLQPTKGQVSVDPTTGAFTYVPTPGKTGTDSFKFRANDGKANSNTAKIEIQIQ